MKAEQLLAHFDRIADAPDAVPRLRQFILGLAVRGKLVEQESEDEPAAAFLEDRALAIARGEETWDLPNGWAWSSLSLLGRTVGGGTPSKLNADFWRGSIPWVTPKDMKVDFIGDSQDHISQEAIENSSAKLIPAGSLLMVVRGMILAHSFPTAVSTTALTINQDMKSLVPFRPDLISMLLLLTKGMKPDVLKLVQRSTHGTGKLLTSELFSLPLPIPPLAEQRRIVAKVDELMALCDQLEAAQDERESRRDRLAAASLARLNNGADAGAFREHARFHLRHLPRLATRPEHIQQLRQAILNLAVRGRLVPQDPNDEPAATLLTQIRREKSRLMNEGAIPKEGRGFGELQESNHHCPKGWRMDQFGRLCNIVTSGARGWAEFYSDVGPKFIRAQNIRFGRLQCNDIARVNPPTKAETKRTAVSKGDLLIVITGAGVTNPAAVDHELGEAYVSQHVALIKPTVTSVTPWFLLCLMAPAACRGQLLESAYGSGKPGLNLNNIRFLRVPIPPLAEQTRIVARVGELLALCNQIEAAHAARQTECRRLLEALLQGQLNGTGLIIEVASRTRALP